MLQKQTSSLQTQVEDLQKDRDFYREQNEKSSRQIESLIEENKELTAEIRAISRSYTVNRT
jgi:peptidoglycan hydrolase CwlO-like protein